MKKTALLVGLVLAFFQPFFAQKTWFLSVEAAPAVRTMNSRYYSDILGTIEGGARKNFSPGLGIRLFREGKRAVQPEAAVEFRTVQYELADGEWLWEQTKRAFFASMAIGYRLESRVFKSGWRVSAGVGLGVMVPFLSQREINSSTFAREWETFYDDPRFNFPLSFGASKSVNSGRRLDFGLVWQRVPEGNWEEGTAFRLLKTRVAVSIDRVEKN